LVEDPYGQTDPEHTPGSSFPEESMTTETTASATETTASATDAIIRKWTYAAAGVGLIPVPIIDLAAIVGIQLKMIADLSAHYGVEFNLNRGKAAIGALTGTVLSRQLAPVAASLLKVIPIIGQFGGAVGMTATAGASTYAVGRVFDQHFASGGTLLNFDASKMKSYFSSEYEKGKTATAKA
jgi:uncharacterized protein (DUF697 family)